MPSDHAKISYVKSAIRIIGYLFLGAISHHPAAPVAAGFLIIAEIIGIIEEFGH